MERQYSVSSCSSKIKHSLGEDGYILTHPGVHELLTLHLKDMLYNMHKMRNLEQSPLTGSLLTILTKIVDPA